MTTIAQIQAAMGPVYLAWAKPATEHHYTPPEFSTVMAPANSPEKCKSDQRIDEALRLLSIRPMTGDEIKKALSCTTRQWAMVFERMPKGAIKHEQIGIGADRYVLYWVDSMPPKLTDRSTSHQVIEFFGRNKRWTAIDKLPMSICKSNNGKHSFVSHLITRGKLIQRWHKGVRQIKVTGSGQ